MTNRFDATPPPPNAEGEDDSLPSTGSRVGPLLVLIALGLIAAGLEPFNHDDYEPGRRFYFFDWDGIEFELVNYD